MFKKLEKVFDILGEILAVLLVIVYAVTLLNAKLDFIEPGTLLNVLNGIRFYGSVILIGVVGLEAMCKRNIVFFLIFLVLLALVVVLMFFPEVFDSMVSTVTSAICQNRKQSGRPRGRPLCAYATRPPPCGGGRSFFFLYCALE